MLRLIDIYKDYYIGKKNSKSFQVVNALKGININFRRSEFVSILGPSGCGKTTLLNIIGGLDHYSKGNLIINGKSTTEYKDRDWDNYRNHSIGFIFQSYNLIPHQNVLTNVELALTLSGVKKQERKERAIEALEKVGLGDKIYSMPNQLSGGQMQRVAIARALVNNPEIILADEPTGALDSETSVQVMEILKEISKEKLIIMVTHNPDLAHAYSTRIIELFDGRITKDSSPYDGDENNKIMENDKKDTKMSFLTAMSLSIKNLMSKKARTSLVSFAGSIGIIGIALILSMSSGFQNYINKVQEETLSSYPLSIAAQTSDMSALLEMFMNNDETPTHDLDAIYSKAIFAKLVQGMQNSVRSNNLREFKTFLETDEEAQEIITKGNISYDYSLRLQIFKNGDASETLATDLVELMSKLPMFGGGTIDMYSTSSSTDIWSQMIDNYDLINRQYEILDGRLPENYDEIIVITDKDNEINDYVLASLGLINEEQLFGGQEIRISYEDILENKYQVLPNPLYYELNENNVAINRKNDTNYIKGLLEDENSGVINLKVVGIVRPNEETVGEVLSGAIGYTSALTKELIKRINESDVVKEQLAHPEKNVFTGQLFEDEERTYKKEDLINYIAGLINSDSKDIYSQYIVDGLLLSAYTLFDTNATSSESPSNLYYLQLIAALKQILGENVSDEEVLAYYHDEYLKLNINQRYALLKEVADPMLEPVIIELFKQQLDEYNNVANLDNNLSILNVCDLDSPWTINIYASDFDNKDEIINLIEHYNSNVKAEGREDDIINYTDYVGLIMDSVSLIIDIVSAVLIAFVSVSLIVSSIMIGVITYISVLERIKEIGILRAMGASKRDIKRVFTAESITIGFLAGLIGIIVTILIIIPINIILKAVVDISNLANLPIVGAIILIGISVFMTFIAGLFPARLASKKDPVIALRTE